MYRVQNIGAWVSPPHPQPTSSRQCQDEGHHTLVPLPMALPVLCLNQEPGHPGDPLGQKECPLAPCLCTILRVNHAGPSWLAEGGFFGSERWCTHMQCICKKTPRRGHVRSTGLCAERCSCDRPPVKATAQRQQSGALASPVSETGPQVRLRALFSWV